MKLKIHFHKNPILIDYVYINKMIVSKMVSLVKKVLDISFVTRITKKLIHYV